VITAASIPGRRERPAMVTAPGSNSGPGRVRTSASGTLPSPGAMPGRAAVRVPWAGADRGLPGSSHLTGTAAPRRRWCPNRLRGAPLAGSRYGSPAAWLTCGSGTGPAPAAHRRPAVRPLPRRTAPGPPHLAPGPRPHRCQRRRDRVLPLGSLLQRFVLLDRHKCPSALRWAPKPAATQPTPVAVLVLNPVVRVCAGRMESEENQIVCGG